MTASGVTMRTAHTPVTSVCLAMGTVNTLHVFHPRADAAIAAAFGRMRALAARLTTFRDDSEIALVNQAAGDHAVAVSDDVYRVVEAAVDVSTQPGSGFDLTIGPLVKLWAIGSGAARRPPEADIAAARALVDARAVELDPARHTVFLRTPGMQLDLGGIAKGYIADQMRETLTRFGVTSAVIDLGGNVVVMGRCPRRADGDWRVGVQVPFARRGVYAGVLRLTDASVVTSGIYERFASISGTQYHHLLDPGTGFPFEGDLAGVTIVSRTSLTGDAWSTRAFAAGLAAGLAAVTQSDGLGAVFVAKDSRVVASDSLSGRFEVTTPGEG